MKLLRRLGIVVAGLVVLVILVALTSAIMDGRPDYAVSTEGVVIPRFSAMDIPYEQNNDFTVAHPFAAGAIIDIDNDGTEELFIGGGPGQPDGLFRFIGGKFKAVPDAAGTEQPSTQTSFGTVAPETGGRFEAVPDVAGIEKPSAVASFGAAVIDTDGNGYDDLLVARTDGIWLHLNNGGSFSSRKLALAIPADTTPMSAAIVDINRDGHFDLYVSGYIRFDLVEGQNIFNKEGYGGSSHLFLNQGDNTFTDVTEAAGLTYKHNAFMGIFVDIDRDGFEDLIVAHDTGQVRTWQNLGDGTFVNHENPNSDQYSYPMGIGVGDYNNDGWIDFALSNVGSTPPNFLIRGDLTDDQESNWKWLLFENQGNFKFRDAASTARIADYEFSWGMTMEDFNLDGREDLVVAENYIGLPLQRIPFLRSPGRLLLQNQFGEFAAIGKEAGVINKRYAIAPVTADFNDDGYPDIVFINIAGRSQAFLSEGGEAGYLKVKLPNRVSSIAAMVEVDLVNGDQLTKTFVSGEGLGSDSSHVLSFGLADTTATTVTVTYIDGRQETQQGNWRNNTVKF